MIPYEALTNIDDSNSVNIARQNMEYGWKLGQYPAIDLKNIPWELPSQNERSWNFHIHSWDMADNLLKAHSQTQETEYLQAAIDIALNWINQPDDISPFSWYDMAVGTRSYRLAYIIDAGRHFKLLDEATYYRMWDSLERHRAYLANDKNIVFHTNHGFYQVTGQLAMGRRFARISPDMEHAYRQGKERLLQMMQTQFAPDGTHREHSPDYHRMVYQTLKTMIESGLIDDAQVTAFADKIEQALSWFILPHGHIANFGDSDYRQLRRDAKTAERKWRTHDMQYMISGGATGTAPDRQLAVFNDGGYAVIRKANRNAAHDVSKGSYLAQTACFHSRTHKHADDLSMIWHDHGADILIDAGRYGYIGKAEKDSPLWNDGYWYNDPNRVYCESTQAHNTLEFDDRNYLRKGAKPYGSAIKRSYQHESGIVAIESEVKQFSSIRHVRVLVFLPAQWLLVFDWFHDNLKLPHHTKQWFHLGKGLALEATPHGYKAYPHTAPAPLHIVSLLEGCELSPPQESRFSHSERMMEPNSAFYFEQKENSTGIFASLFSFADEVAPQRSLSQCNVSGRNARLCWQQNGELHTIIIERGDEFAVNYTTQKAK